MNIYLAERKRDIFEKKRKKLSGRKKETVGKRKNRNTFCRKKEKKLLENRKNRI